MEIFSDDTRCLKICYTKIIQLRQLLLGWLCCIVRNLFHLKYFHPKIKWTKIKLITVIIEIRASYKLNNNHVNETYIPLLININQWWQQHHDSSLLKGRYVPGFTHESPHVWAFLPSAPPPPPWAICWHGSTISEPPHLQNLSLQLYNKCNHAIWHIHKYHVCYASADQQCTFCDILNGETI